jgi:hypothetical protein
MIMPRAVSIPALIFLAALMLMGYHLNSWGEEIVTPETQPDKVQLETIKKTI